MFVIMLSDFNFILYMSQLITIPKHKDSAMQKFYEFKNILSYYSFCRFSFTLHFI